MGAELIVGASIAAAGLIGSSVMSAVNNNRSIHTQKQMQERQFQMQNELYDKQVATERENYEKYNSPQAMTRQLLGAGVNPAAYFGSGSGSSQGVTSPAMPTAPSGSFPSLQNPLEGVPDSVNKLASAMSSVSNSKLTDFEKQKQQSLLESEMRNWFLKNNNLELANNYQSLMNSITETYGKGKAAAEIKSLLGSAFASFADGKASLAQEKLNNINTKLAKQTWKYNEDAYPKMLMNLDQTNKLMVAQTELESEKKVTEKSMQYANFATAENQRESAETTRQLRPEQVKQAENLAEKIKSEGATARFQARKALSEVSRIQNYEEWRKKYPWLARQLDEFGFLTNGARVESGNKGSSGLSAGTIALLMKLLK